jgi:hypothetical protein
MSKTAKRAALSEKSQADEGKLREAAYLLWEQSTGGSPVDDEQSRRFWLEAEQQLNGGDSNGNGHS